MAQYIKTEEGYKEFATVTNNKMDKTDPTGTGSFSMNRKAGTVIGTNSHAEGYQTTANGNCSHAEGYQTTASGSYSHAEGYRTTASQSYSHAEGCRTTASEFYSHAEGCRTTASGFSSHAEGGSANVFSSIVTTTNPTTDDIIPAWKIKKFSVANGYYSHVEGRDNLALDDYSHAEGYQTTASGSSSHAEGYLTRAMEKYSHTEGGNTTASGLCSHAEGGNTQASGLYSHAEGYQTTASGNCSNAEGYKTTASGHYSHAEGYYTTASGNNSHAEGNNTKANGTDSHVQGKYNIEDTSNTYADIIGNGASTTARSNAATVDWNGNAWFAGDVYTGSTSGTNKDEGSKKLATEEYVNSSIAATSVLYTAQSLTEEQKVQARQNIGAQNLYNGLTPVSYSCTDGTYSVSDTVYLESGNIISPVDTVSNDVRLAFRHINFWGAPTQLDYWKDDIKKYKLLIDNGYLENNTIWYSKPDKKFKKQIRFGTNNTLGNYIIFNFNYNYDVIGQLVYYVDTDTISTGTDTYLNRILKRDKNDVLSYSAIKLSSDPAEPMQIATKHYVDNAPIKQASATELGGVKADSAEAADTQPVRIGGDGKLYTTPGGTDISLGLTSAAVGQIIKVKAIDESGKPTAWEAAYMPSGGGGHWETVLDTVWEQDVINPTAFDSETGIFTCAEGELNNLELNKEYVFFPQCKEQGVAYNTILNDNLAKVTKLSNTTFSIDVTPPTTFVPTNVKFSRGACLAITDIDAKKIRLTLDGQFRPTATLYDKPFYGMNVPFFGQNTGYQQIRNAYQAYQQVTAEVESPYRIVGEILCGFNAPSSNGNFHFKNNSFCCPLFPAEFSKGDSMFSSDGTKIAKLYSTSSPWMLGTASENTAIGSDYLKIISGTKVKLERWVE